MPILILYTKIHCSTIWVHCTVAVKEAINKWWTAGHPGEQRERVMLLLISIHLPPGGATYYRHR